MVQDAGDLTADSAPSDIAVDRARSRISGEAEHFSPEFGLPDVIFSCEAVMRRADCVLGRSGCL